MLARSWDGETRVQDADEYVEYLRRTGVADLASTDGNLGVFVLRREDVDRASFRLLSLWESEDAIRGFAGDDPERARYYPDDERFLLALTPGVEHYEVVIRTGGSHWAGEGQALASELRAIWHGDAWHGPALGELLDDVSSDDAAARPLRGGHSLWELVLHLAAWTDTWRRRLEGQVLAEPEAGDFPPVLAATSEAWTVSKARLEDAHESLTERVAHLEPAELDATVPGCEYDARYLVKGAIRHTVYHSGQIALLKKAVAPTTGRRDHEAEPSFSTVAPDRS
ncbi:MAG: DinB family protein [Acidobacteriota bacterium]|jgi:uncharacterized damage-inducible protein DinB/heme-degrading monooxygenase HmoA